VRAHAHRSSYPWPSRTAGQAEVVLADAHLWQPIVLYNTSGVDEAGVEAMMARGWEVLSEVPGVR
jgi:hypothetical protein